MSTTTSSNVCSTDPLYLLCHSLATYSPAVFLFSRRLSRNDVIDVILDTCEVPRDARKARVLLLSLVVKVDSRLMKRKDPTCKEPAVGPKQNDCRYQVQDVIEHLRGKVRVSALQVEVEALDCCRCVQRFELLTLNFHVWDLALPPCEPQIAGLVRDEAVPQDIGRRVGPKEYRENLVPVHLFDRGVKVLYELFKLRIEPGKAVK